MIKEFLVDYATQLYFGLFFFLAMISAAIALKAKKLYSVSNYEGIKFFRNSFVFFSVAFVLRCALYIIHFFEKAGKIPLNDFAVLHAVVEYTFIFSITIAGFYLVYSLVWKTLQGFRIGNMNLSTESSLYVLAALVTFAEEVMISGFMYVAMILVFSYAIIVSYNNYIEAKRKSKKGFHQLYFIVMVLGLLGFASNFLDFLISGFFPTFYVYVIILNVMIFGIMFYGVFFVTKNG